MSSGAVAAPKEDGFKNLGYAAVKGSGWLLRHISDGNFRLEEHILTAFYSVEQTTGLMFT